MNLLDKNILEKKIEILQRIEQELPSILENSSKIHQIRKSITSLERGATKALASIDKFDSESAQQGQEIVQYLEEILETISHIKLALWYFKK